MMHVSKHGYPALRLILLWSLGGFLLIGHSYQYPLDRRNAKIIYGHLGASCSNIGRIRTKENIAVDTHLIGKVPSSLGS